jgi:hypothetical protein
MSQPSTIGQREDIPAALASVMTAGERVLLELVLDPNADSSDIVRRLLQDALSD